MASFVSAFTMGTTISFPQCKAMFISVHKLQGRGFSSFRKVMSIKAQAYDKEPNGFRINTSFKVAILGVSHGIGPVLSSELRTFPLVSTLRLYSIEDFDELDATRCQDHLTGLDETLKDIDVVVIAGRVPTIVPYHDNYFIANATIVRFFVEAVADHCPGAFIIIANDLLNSIVPMAAEVLKQRAMYYPEKLFGVMAPEVELARAIVAEEYILDVERVEVPVIGGHCTFTTLPLFSKTKPHLDLTDLETHRLKYETHYRMTRSPYILEYFEDIGVVRFVLSLLRALDGDEDVFQCCFVESRVTDLPFFASTVKLGKMGLEAVIEPDLEGITKSEAQTLKDLINDLREDIEKGIMFANKTPEAY